MIDTMSYEHEMQPLPGNMDTVQLVITTSGIAPLVPMLVVYEVDGEERRAIGHPYQGVPVPAGAVVKSVEIGEGRLV